MKLLALICSLMCMTVQYMGFDLSQLFTLDTYQCFVRNGATFGVINAFTETGTLNQYALQNLMELQKLGLNTDISMKTCRGMDPVAQVNKMMDSIPSQYYQKIWVEIVKNPTPGCTWESYSATSNCDYLNQMIQAIDNRGKDAGVYTSVPDWMSIFNDISACPDQSDRPLWYEYADNKQSFENYRSIAAWSQPTMKRYTLNYTWCGTQTTNLNYRP